MRSDTTGYVEAELPQRGFLRLVLQLGLECSRLLQIEAPARQSRPDDHTSRDPEVAPPRSARRVAAPWGATRGGMEARLARTACELLLAGVIRICASWGVDGVMGRGVAVGSPTLVGMLFYGTASLRLRSR